MKLSVLSDEYFSCRSCTNCCRDWHVELLEGEAERIQGLAWADGDPLRDSQILLPHAGKTYLAHKPDGACVFLNSANGLCRIHEQFGGDLKPLGCQLYPFQIAPTFRGEATVTARYDCPTVRRNEGAAHADSLPQLKRYAQKLQPQLLSHLLNGFDERTCCSFKREQIEAVCEFSGTLLGGFDRNEHRALFIAYLCDWLGTVHPADVDRSALAGIFKQLKAQIENACASATSRPGLIHRLAFRTLLALYLRRDEDVLDGRAGRVSRLFAMLAFVFGRGSVRGLGVSHPPGKLRQASLFQPKIKSPDAAVFALHWRMIRNKLESLQFMGAANRGRDFLNGLHSLALLYPLVLAAAKIRAANRQSNAIDASDVDYAVVAIEHSFGRAAILGRPFVRSIENFLLERGAFGRLVFGI